MNSWHNQLLQKYPTYHRWHQHPHHPFWHWVVFSFVVIFVFNHLYANIGDYLNEETLSVSIQTPQAQAAGNTYYVAKTGSNNNTCTQAQSAGTAKLTIAAGLACLSGGDTLVIKAGTYTEGIEGSAVPSGISDTQRTIVKAAPGETVIINGVNSLGYTVKIANRNYVTLDGIIFDGANAGNDRAIINMGTTGATGDPGVHFITVQNGTVRRTGANSLVCIETHGYPSGLSSNILLKNLDIYGCGSSSLYHGIYLNAQDSIIESNKIHDNFGHGIQIFSSDGTTNASRNIIRNNRIYNNGSFGIGLYSGNGNLAYNNLVYGNGANTGYGGIRTGFGGGVNSQIYNNTVYGNQGYCTWIQSAGSVSAVIRNNICYLNINNTIQNDSTNSTVDNNIFTNPFFVNISTLDFHLQSTSPAINTGVTLAEVTADYDGISRPQGSAYDIGAYEYGGVAGTPTPTPTPTPPSPSSNPVGWWKFDEGTGGTTADASGSGNTGTLVNGPTWVTGKIGSGIQFDGINDAVNLGDVLDFTSPSMTLSAWIKPNSLGGGGYGRILDKAIWYWGLNTGNNMFFNVGGGTTSSADNVIAFGTWQHVSLTYDGAQVRFYVNGVAAGIPNMTAIPSGVANPLYIGQVSGGTSRTFDGAIDDVRIYNQVLSASEIQTLYSQASITLLSSCDLNQDTKTDILDFQLLANVILGITANTGGYDINKDGQVNILDTQVLANVILGKASCP